MVPKGARRQVQGPRQFGRNGTGIIVRLPGARLRSARQAQRQALPAINPPYDDCRPSPVSQWRERPFGHPHPHPSAHDPEALHYVRPDLPGPCRLTQTDFGPAHVLGLASVLARPDPSGIPDPHLEGDAMMALLGGSCHPTLSTMIPTFASRRTRILARRHTDPAPMKAWSRCLGVRPFRQAGSGGMSSHRICRTPKIREGRNGRRRWRLVWPCQVMTMTAH